MDYIALLVAVVIQVVVGVLWYSPLMFGKTWMKVMETSHLTKEEMKKMEKEMTPFYALQAFLTLTMTWVFASNINFYEISGAAVYFFAFFIWLGYMMPVTVSSVIWGNTKKKFWIKQISIMCGMQIVCIMIAAFVLTNL